MDKMTTLDKILDTHALLYSLPLDEYFAHPGINSSRIKLMLKTPMDFKEDDSNEETTSKVLGSAIHTLLLEPEEFDKRYAVYNKRKAGKEYLDFKKANAGKVFLDKKQVACIERLREKLEQNVHLRFILASGKSEVTGIIEDKDTGLVRKARADKLTKNTIWDVKTTAKGMSDGELYKEIKKYKYDLSAAHYMAVFNGCLDNQIKNFGWIFINTKPNVMHIRLLLCPESLLNDAIFEYENVIKDLVYCMQNDKWEGYSAEIRELEIPEWATKRRG